MSIAKFEEEVEITDFASFLSLWPTLKEVGRVCDVEPNNVVQWRRRNNIPPRFWRDLLADLTERGIDGITIDDLLDFVEAR